MEWWLVTVALGVVALWLGRKLGARPRRDPAPAMPDGDVETPGMPDEDFETAAPIAIGDELDLHGVPGREVAGFVEEFLEVARERGSRSVTIVHGRGTGVLRRRVRALLARHPSVERYADATGRAGGATVVWLVPLAGSPRAD